MYKRTGYVLIHLIKHYLCTFIFRRNRMDTEKKETKEINKLSLLIMAVVVLILIIAGAGYYIYQQKQQMNDLVEAYDLDKQTLEDEFNELSMQYEGYQFKVGNDSLMSLLSTEQAKVQRLMEELRTEEERHIKEELSEAELELFDLLRKEQLTADEEKHVKLAAKELYNTLTEKRNELFIVGWQNDPQPKERVKGEIVYILNKFLPESYDREVFLRKSTLVFDHIVDQAMTGYNWVA